MGKSVRIQRLNCIRKDGPHAHIQIGSHTLIYEHAKIESYSQGRIEIGEASIIGDTRIFSRLNIKIGERFLSSWNTFIQDFDAHPLEMELRKKQMEGLRGIGAGLENWEFPCESISVGDDVWMGANSTILKGAHIGSGCVIAAHAVVAAGNYPEQSLLAGVPAKVIKSLKLVNR